MKISRSINNNIVSAYDDDGREAVIIGKGIGYKAQEGDIIPQTKIDKIFIIQNETERLKEILTALPEEYIEITSEIISYAKKYLKRQLHEGIYVTLADHINITVMRTRQGMNFYNVLHTEIRCFYSEEYAIGQYALDLIEKRLGISLPSDEAASIALHIFDAEYDISISDAFHATQLLNCILNIAMKENGLSINEDDYYCERFITHLKFLTQRVVKKESLPESDDDFFEFIRQRYLEELQCSKHIAAYISENYGYNISNEEMASLAIHIRRIGRLRNVVN